jgi:Exo-beta-D-glucosaminidase Ig-fold domain/Glycosyl hydrolases family 2/Concanavalin A-like lectin/glucanases superfamily/Glycosyl hydrolases family 2, TIM barrel domain
VERQILSGRRIVIRQSGIPSQTVARAATNSRVPLQAVRFLFLFLLAGGFFITAIQAQFVPTNNPPQYGPYNAIFLRGGDGLHSQLTANDTVTRADSPWTLWCWVRFEEPIKAPTLVAGLGEITEEYPRYLSLDAGKVILWMGENNSLSGSATLAPGKWHFLAAAFDGKEFSIYANGDQISRGTLVLGSVGTLLQMAPPAASLPRSEHFGGKIADFVLVRQALSGKEIQQLAQAPPDFSIILFDTGSKPWPVQTRGQAGYRAPQDPSEMPRSNAPFSKPVARPVPSGPALRETAHNTWLIDGGWRLQAAPLVAADGAAIAQPSLDASKWMVAVVPGTVLTTMVERGVYADPEYGLNNLAIPESLNKQHYWYRVELPSPAGLGGKHLSLTFQGINYRAVVWLNGKSLGTITGAFIRGTFDVTGIWKAGKGETNVLAVEVSPPPHPGIPQEQSVKGGPGENGGIMCLDGPTFVASEGWDWIPAVRDRETGIWQGVELKAVQAVKLGDTQVITELPLPDTSRADIKINVPLENLLDKRVRGTLKVSFENVELTKELTLPPGSSTVALTPAEFKQLTVQNPRLWWPNGYGKQELYHLKLSFDEGGGSSDSKETRFGIREITYELSLLDSKGDLRRVEIDPTRGKEGFAGVVDVSHDGMRQIPAAEPPPPNLPKAFLENWHSWVASLAPGAESSPAVKEASDEKAAPYLVLKVNGVKIACRGGSWGMDDFMKRVSRERLEPYFRLHQEAHMNMIRNWVGQDTEEIFFDLADEYGLLIWNDFWETTQNYNVEAEDPQLLLSNVRDTILRYRNHPSVAVWCGRNEGVPQPIVNTGITVLVNSLDGTRYYSPSSNQINLQGSGPYRYMDPKLYFTRLNRGFSVETGTPSLSTAESFRSSIPAEDLWPINDVWAYHDWHQSGNGDMAPFMEEMQAEFGAPINFEDFERKAQMIDYVSHRAIFEGMNAHLWAPNSGRMLWMTQPAWASNVWQIFSHDYDTQSSFYGVKKACEPIHIQLDLSNFLVQVVNTTTAPLSGVVLSANVVSLDNRQLAHHEEHKDVPQDSVIEGFPLDLKPYLSSGIVVVKLELHDTAGKLLSQNFYLLGAEGSSYRALGRLPSAEVAATAVSVRHTDKEMVHVSLQNRGSVVSLQIKLTLANAKDGSRILPAYYDDNYVSLLPGESRDIEVEYAPSVDAGPVQIALRGWNLVPYTLTVSHAN